MACEFSLSNFLGQVFVVGAGWYVVHRLSVARDIDKSRREMISKAADSLMENLTELLSEIRDYHLGCRNYSLELKIKSSIQDANMRCVGLNAVCGEKNIIKSCTSSIGAVRRAATREHFEDEHDAPLSPGAALLEDVAAAVVRAKQDLLRLKHSQFPKNA